MAHWQEEHESSFAAGDEKFRRLCQAAFDGVLVHDQGTIVEASDKCALMFRCSISDIVGKSIFDFTAPEMHERVLTHAAARSDRPFESIGLRHDGERFPLEVSGISMDSSSLRVVALRDVSDRKRCEQRRDQENSALIASEDRYRDIVDNCHDLICTHDLDGRILSVNPAGCQALGTTADALCSMRIQDLLLPLSSNGYTQYVTNLKRDGVASGTMVVATRDGRRRLWEYRNTLRIEGVISPIVRGIARDVTDREDALHAVRQSEEHFRSIIENVSDVIAIVEPDGRLRYQSPSVERVLGYPASALVDTPFVDLVHLDDTVRATQFLARQVADRDAIQTIELRLRHQSGAWRSFEIVARNLVEGGRVSSILTNARDITDRKFLEAQLAQANRLTSLGRLAATVAHEFNNVLMGMQPFTELLQRPDVEPSMIAKAVWHISNSIQRGKRIALDILRFTQPAEPVTAVVDVGEWWEKFAPEAEAVLGNMIRLVSAIPRHGLCVVADRGQLSQVLANLTVNARDAMPSGGTLTVQAGVPVPNAMFPFGIVLGPDRFVHISVADSGPGMPPEVMERVFEPLFTTKQNGGTGLGLAVAHQVLKQHGGHIFVESEAGQGTTFHLFVPRSGSGCASEEPEEADVEHHRLHTRKLLMVEDEPFIVEGISALLSFSGIEVHSVSRGADAAEAVERFHPDVVLLDFGLPDLDGAEVYRRIRKLDESLPVIFATGHADLQTIQDELGDRRTRFLQKPFDVAALMETIGDLERSEGGR
jgi:PAS domain S-box-containing protein